MLDLNEIFATIDPPTTPLQVDQVEFAFRAKTEGYLQEQIGKRNNLANRLERLISETRINGQPVIELILRAFPQATPEELSTLGKALQRISELAPHWEKINAEVNGLRWAAENTNSLALAFGNFESPESDYFLSQS